MSHRSTAVTKRQTVRSATPKPCAACPWRISNQGTHHPGGWYTKANLRRLWAGLRRGERMTCHPTDPDNPVPDGLPQVSENAKTNECAGAIILQQREFMRFQAIALATDGNGMREYRKAHPKGMLRDGLVSLAERYVFGGTPFDRIPMARPNLNQEGIGHPDLVPWTTEEMEEIKRATSH